MHNLIGCKIHRFIDPMHQTLSNPIKIWHCTHTLRTRDLLHKHMMLARLWLWRWGEKMASKMHVAPWIWIFSMAVFIFLSVFICIRYELTLQHIANAQMRAIVKQTQWHLQTDASPPGWRWWILTNSEWGGGAGALNQCQTSNLFDSGPSTKRWQISDSLTRSYSKESILISCQWSKLFEAN